jgi:hypothetical protein
MSNVFSQPLTLFKDNVYKMYNEIKAVRKSIKPFEQPFRILFLVQLI